MSTPTLPPQHRARSGTAGTSRITRALSILSATALVALGTITTSSPALAAPDDPIAFTDANLHACVNETLDPARDADAGVTEAEAASLLMLDCFGQSVASLDGIEHFTNLEQIYLDDNQLTDVSALENLSRLRALWLGSNQITDVSALGSLTNLDSLNLSVNQITDVSALGGLTNLETLNLDDNQISDVSALGNLTNLERLSLHTNQISDVSALGNLTNLEILYLNKNQIADVSVLGNLNSLWEVYLAENQITDLSPLAGQTLYRTTYENQEVDLGNVMVGEDIPNPVIDKLGNPVELSDLYDPATNTFTPTAPGTDSVTWANNRQGFTGTLYFSGVDGSTAYVSFTDANLQACVNEALDPARDADADITEAEAASVSHLSCAFEGIASLGGLEHFTNLELLDLGANQITDVSALGSLTNLQSLALPRNQITDVSALGSLTNLAALYLEKNQITDLSPLSGLGGGYFRFEDQEVDLGDVIVGQDAANPVIHRNGDPVALSDLYDPATNTFTPTTPGIVSITWDDGVFFTGTLHFTAVDAPTSYVNFTDANLQACVNESLDPARDADADVTEAEAASLDELECFNMSIASLDGLEHFTGLDKLRLPQNDISDLTPLAALTNLELLRLEENNISDVVALHDLTNLQYLDLSDNKISDVTPLTELTAITAAIYLNRNHIVDLSPLPSRPYSAEDQFVDLGDVHLDEPIPNPVVTRDGDPVPLSLFYDAATNTFTPTVIGAGAVQWSEGPAFSGELSFNVISAPAYVNFTDANLQACVNETLDPARDADADVTEAEAASIDDLECINDDISSLDGLEHFVNLQRLYLFGNEVHDVTPLENLTALDFLNLGNNQITDEGVRTLGNFPSLTHLYLSQNQITDVSPLANLSSLTYLHFHENQITDVSPLAGLTDLRSLGFNANHVVDVSSLSGLSLIRFSAENQTVDLGNMIVDQDAANPVIDRNGDPVALNDLYDAATNTFTPTTLGADSVTWDDGDAFTGTLNFTAVEAGGDDPGGNGDDEGNGSDEEDGNGAGEGEGDESGTNGSDDDASNEQLPRTGSPAFVLPVGFAALALLGIGAALLAGSRRRNRLTAREG